MNTIKEKKNDQKNSFKLRKAVVLFQSNDFFVIIMSSW